MIIRKNRQFNKFTPLEISANCDLSVSLELSANSNLLPSTKVWMAFLTGQAWWWTLFFNSQSPTLF